MLKNRSMVGGTNHGKSAAATENGAQKAGDVPVRDAAKKALLGLCEGLSGILRAVSGMVTRQGVPWLDVDAQDLEAGFPGLQTGPR